MRSTCRLAGRIRREMGKFIRLPVNIVSRVHAFGVSVSMVQFVHRVDIWGLEDVFHLGGNQYFPCASRSQDGDR